MKPLQLDFTTPEQSKRLLELGLPADSADCYISHNVDKEDNPLDYRIGIRQNEVEKSLHFFTHELPCWSVGRLIEIIMLCGTSANHKLKPILDSDLYETHDTLIEYLVQELEENNEDWYDFSKLED